MAMQILNIEWSKFKVAARVVILCQEIIPCGKNGTYDYILEVCLAKDKGVQYKSRLSS